MNKVYYPRLNEALYSTVLKNGLKVYMVPKADFQKTYCVFKTDFGSIHTNFIHRDTNEKISFPQGTAHFLEHQMFAMEKNKDAGDYFASLGADSNAYTSYDETAYTVTCTKKQKEVIQFLLDFVQKPCFTAQGIAKEKKIILQEYLMYQDKPNNRLHYDLMNNLYWNDPLKEEIVGNEESIKKINKKILLQAHQFLYHPQNMTLLIVGHLHVEETLQWIMDNQNGKQFSPCPPVEIKTPIEPLSIHKEFNRFEMDIFSPYVAYGIKINPHLYEKFNIIKIDYIMKIILEQLFGSSSDTYQELLDQDLISKRFRYYAHITNNSMYIAMQSDSKHPEQLLNYFENKFLNGRRDELQEANFTRIKKGIIGSFIKSMDDVETITHGILDALTLNCDYFNSLDILESITMEDILLVYDVIKNSPHTKVIINPKKVAKKE